jgi:hypothetical protein
LVQRRKQAIEKIRVELGDRPTQANDIIKFLNSKTREELEELKIEDRIETILEVKRVLTKRGLTLQLEEKVQTMDLGVQKFFSKFEALQKKGLPGLKVINDKLMTLPDYKKRLSEVSKDSSKLLAYKGASLVKHSWMLFSWTSVSNMRFDTYSSLSPHSPSIRKWTKCIGDCSKLLCLVISDGRNSVIYSIRK